MKTTQFIFGLCALVEFSIGVSAFSAAVEHVAVMASTLDTSGPACPIYPKPPHTACGVQKEPVHRRAMIERTRAENITACAADCLAIDTCLSFTYTDICGVCKLYKKTANHMAIQRSEDGTRFYNRNCFSDGPEVNAFIAVVTAPKSSPFYQQVVIAAVNDTANGYGYNPARIVDPATVTNDTIAEAVFGIFCDGYLANFAVAITTDGLGAYRYYAPGDGALVANVFLPDSNTTAEFTAEEQILCSIGSKKNNNGTLLCESGAGNTFYGCTSDDPLVNNSLAIASPALPPPGGNCNPVKLETFVIGQI